MSLLNTLRDVRSKLGLWIGLPLFAAVGMVFAADIVPAWQARGGTGDVGVFTAAREECGRRSCSFHGDWVSAGGDRRRDDVILYDEPDDLRTGGTTEAIDSGAREGVFATAGGTTYLLATGMALGGLAAAVGWVVMVVRAVRRRLAPTTASASVQPGGAPARGRPRTPRR